MSATESQVKEIVVRGLQEILHPHVLPEPRKSNNVDTFPKSSLNTEIVVTRNFSKSIKSFVEHSLSDDIDSHLREIGNANKETWKIDAHNLSKVLLDQSKLLCVQDNISNILDSCLKEVNDPSFKYLNDSELDISPLLQPEHIFEVAECMSAEKPLDVRLNALRVLLKSHFTEAVNGNEWFLLQKKLVENLCDDNTEVFVTCLKAHAKLGSCSSPMAIKECVLNLLESLSRHYHLQQGECKVISFQSIYFYRMVYLTRLLLDTLREATLNVARFGESRFDEMIDNLVQLLSIHVPSKQSRNKPFLSPLEVVSFLDPNGHWLVNLTHFTLTRQLFFSSLSKNIGFLQIAVEEIVNWVNEPVIPSRNTSKVLHGELNVAVHKYSLFCHSFAVFATTCSFGVGCSLFPVNINKNEDLLSIEDVLRMLIATLNDVKFSAMLHSKSTLMFRTFIARRIAKLLCLKEVNGNSLLLMLLKTHDSQDDQVNTIKITILDSISQYKHLHNPFINPEMRLKRKIPMFLHCFISNTLCSTNQISGSITQKRDIERQVSLRLPVDAEINVIFPFEVYVQNLTDKLESTGTDFLEGPCLIQIMTRMFKDFDRILGINYSLRARATQLVAEIYIKMQQSFKHREIKFNIRPSDISLSGYCAQFLLQVAASSLGFHILQEFGVVAPLLLDGLQHPVIDWSDPTWLLFISKATPTLEGFGVLAAESNVIVRNELTRLWNVIEEDCSGSDLPFEDTSKQLLRIVSALTLSLTGVRAVLNELRNGSDVTLTDECDIRPSNLHFLIENFALNDGNCPDFIHHQFALTVLEIVTSNIDSSLYLQHRLKYQDILLQLQSDNRVDENSEVIIDECSLLRHRIIERTYLPGRVRVDIKPTHTAPRPESTLARYKPRSRNTGEFARWLGETRLSLHDHSWLKHARKLYRNSCTDDIKGSTILDLLEQVVKVLPETRATVKWLSVGNEDMLLEPEEQLAVQLVMRYGTHHRLIQLTQQNSDNLTHLIRLVKASLNHKSNKFEGFDWFVATAYLMCSGNIEKSQTFLSLVSSLPIAPLLWLRLGQPSVLAQMGNVFETIIAEELPALFQVLQSIGFSWWHLCLTWLAQCWWNMLDWQQICHWFTHSILHQSDHLLYFCVALLHANHDRLLRIAQQGTFYEIIMNPVEKFQLADTRTLIEKLHKKYHNNLHSHLASTLHL